MQMDKFIYLKSILQSTRQTLEKEMADNFSKLY